MNSKKAMPKKARHTSLILVEGATEMEFYKAIADNCLNKAPRIFKDLRGNFNIHTKVLDASTSHSDRHPDDTFDVYVCIDQDRIGEPVINRETLNRELARIRGFKTLTCVIAVLVIESLFFIDIDGIYAFLRAPHNKRKPKKYSEYRALTDRDLKALFKSFDKIYQKGHHCKSLVSSLNIKKIIDEADELKQFIEAYNTKS
ncbi:MAG TPA: DUF4276 family protein [Gammaproteobacteria bacterium]|nr:DUF4276 family protein [Gammaproteobacteria bacterium]